jgi:hypothetical protein
VSDLDLRIKLQAAEHLSDVEADRFDYRCGVLRADIIDKVILDAVEARGLSLFDDGMVERVVLEHDGPVRVRVLLDGAPVTPWWADRLVIADGQRTWTYEPVPAEDAPVDTPAEKDVAAASTAAPVSAASAGEAGPPDDGWDT